jgi:hypothetical protein
MCWYLAAGDKSCNEACATTGGFDTRAFTYIGTPSQGGSLSECKQILTALGHAGTVVEATQTSGLGIGCHVWTDGRLYWLSDPAFDPAAKANTPDHNSHIACACMN